MQLAHRAALNGAQLDEIDPRIIIKGIEGASGKETVGSVSRGAGDGTRITGKQRDSLEISIRFSLNIRRDAIEERAAVMEAINAWAWKGGWLTVNYKPDRRIYIDEVVLPGEGDLWRRLTEYTIVMRARAIPYWTQETAVSAATGTGSSGSAGLQVAGSAETVCDAILENLSGATINTAVITVGQSTMRFEGLGMGAGESLRISHTDEGILQIRVGGRSAMAMRTQDSADELAVSPGINAISFSAQRACRLTVSCMGRFA